MVSKVWVLPFSVILIPVFILPNTENLGEFNIIKIPRI